MDPAERLRARRLYFKTQVCRDPCRVCGTNDRLQAHHVIAQQQLKRMYSGDQLERVLWSEENGMSLCESCHIRHEARSAPVPYGLLSEEHIQFAADHGLDWLLERRYPA